MNEKKRPNQAPRAIGLALSGGGYPGCRLHFGSIAYLNRVSLLPAVQAISPRESGLMRRIVGPDRRESQEEV